MAMQGESLLGQDDIPHALSLLPEASEKGNGFPKTGTTQENNSIYHINTMSVLSLGCLTIY